MAKKKKGKNLEDFLNELSTKQSKSIGDAFKAFDDHSDEDTQTEYLSLFIDGHQDFYNTLQSKLDGAFSAKDKLKKKDHDKVKGMVTESLKKYFAKVSPGHLEAIKGMNEDDVYEHLTLEYDKHTGAGQQGSKAASLRKTVKELLDGEVRAGKFKETMYKIGPQNAEHALNVMNSKHLSHHLGPHNHNNKVHQYIKTELGKKGMEIKKDKLLGFWQSDLMDLMKMRELYMEKKAHPYLSEKKAK
jgi:hypothetical protein